MRAAILREIGKPLSVENLSFSSGLGVGQVLVRVKASGICGAQLGEISGSKGPDKYLPHLLGHEGGGIVEAVGPGVTKVKADDHVVLHWRKGSGIEAAPPQYIDRNDQIVGGGWVTTFNDLAIVSENRVTPIDKRVDFAVAALLGCGVTTGLGLVNNEAQLKIGQSIAVAGVGGVGLNVVQGARLVGAGAIIAIDLSDYRRQMALNFGADHIDESLLFFRENGKNVDVFVDCTGNAQMIAEGLSLVKPGGKMILVGQPHIDHGQTFPKFRQHYCGKTIMDSQGGLTNPDIDIPRYVKMYQSGKLDLDSLITHKFKLDNINQALETMRSGNCGRCIVEM